MTSRLARLFCALIALQSTTNAKLSPRNPRPDQRNFEPAEDVDFLEVDTCYPHEEACPETADADVWLCIDAEAPATCGGCTTTGKGMDCSQVPGYFDYGCTKRGQCTGCRWKHGGLSKSKSAQDYIVCSVIKTAPYTPRHKGPPREKFVKSSKDSEIHQSGAQRVIQAPGVVEKEKAKADMEAKKKAEKEELRAKAQKEAEQEPAKADEPEAPSLTLNDIDWKRLPTLPYWISSLLTKEEGPMDASDEALAIWLEDFQAFYEPIRLARPNNRPKSGDKKLTNAERFKMGLPPLSPIDLVRASNKIPTDPWEFIIFMGVQQKVDNWDNRLYEAMRKVSQSTVRGALYTDEEIAKAGGRVNGQKPEDNAIKLDDAAQDAILNEELGLTASQELEKFLKDMAAKKKEDEENKMAIEEETWEEHQRIRDAKFEKERQALLKAVAAEARAKKGIHKLLMGDDESDLNP